MSQVANTPVQAAAGSQPGRLTYDGFHYVGVKGCRLPDTCPRYSSHVRAEGASRLRYCTAGCERAVCGSCGRTVPTIPPFPVGSNYLPGPRGVCQCLPAAGPSFSPCGPCQPPRHEGGRYGSVLSQGYGKRNTLTGPKLADLPAVASRGGWQFPSAGPSPGACRYRLTMKNLPHASWLVNNVSRRVCGETLAGLRHVVRGAAAAVLDPVQCAELRVVDKRGDRPGARVFSGDRLRGCDHAVQH